MNFLDNTKSIFFKNETMPEALSKFLIALDNDFNKTLNGWQTLIDESEVGTSGIFQVQNFKNFPNLQFTITVGKVDTGTFSSLNNVGQRALELFNNHELLIFEVLKNAPTITKVLNELNIKQFNPTSFILIQDPNFDGDINYNPFLMAITLWSDILGFDIKISISDRELS